MRDHLTHAVEDYLKAIYELSAGGERAGTSDLAQALDVTPASVTGMLQRLAAADPPLVEYRKHRGVALTPAGERIALEIIRHHRLLEMYLHRELGFAWDEVHEEADRLEHVISEELEERIAKALGDPSHDPHGDPIPDRDLSVPPSEGVLMLALRPPARGVVRRVLNEDRELLRFLDSRGLRPGAQVEVLSYSEFDRNLRVRVADQEEPIMLGERVTRQIVVERNA